MNQRTLVAPNTLNVATMPRRRLLESLQQARVQLNDSAMTLLNNPVFDHPEPQAVTVVERSVADLGMASGATLSRIFAAAQERSLHLCPATTAPYLRLALRCQATAPDSVISNGKAPSGSLTVAAPMLQASEDYPKGFYLRVIAGRPWLRGYHCSSNGHVWDPDDRFVFSVLPS